MPNGQLLCSVLGGLSFLVFKKKTVFSVLMLPESVKCHAIARALPPIYVLVMQVQRVLSLSTGGISGWVVLRPGHTRPSCASPDAQRVPGISPRDVSSTPPARPDHGACLQALPDGPWGLSCSWSRNAVAGGIGRCSGKPGAVSF